MDELSTSLGNDETAKLQPALQATLELARATAVLKVHLEQKQQLLLAEKVTELGALLIQETPLLRRVHKAQQQLDHRLRQLGKLSLDKEAEPAYDLWFAEAYATATAAEQAELVQIPGNILACREMQLQQQELVQNALNYYESMSRFLSGVQQWTYSKPENNW